MRVSEGRERVSDRVFEDGMFVRCMCEGVRIEGKEEMGKDIWMEKG